MNQRKLLKDQSSKSRDPRATNEISMPHDHLFKAVLTYHEAAKEFFATYLPATLLGKIVLERLELQPTSYVDEDLKEYFLDIVYRFPCKDAREGYLCVLVEHQRNPDFFMPLRILHYQVLVLLRYRKEHPDSRTLPIVFPVLFYQGQKNYRVYPYSLDILDLFGDPKLAGQTLAKQILLVDLNQLKDAQLKEHKFLGLFELIEKHAQMHKPEDLLRQHKKVFKKVSKLKNTFLRDAYLKEIINYLLVVGRNIDKEAIMRQLTRMPLAGGKIMKSAAQALFDEGRETGEKLGVQKGEKRGLQKGQILARRTVIHNLLREGFSLSRIAKFTGLTTAAVRRLAKTSSQEVKGRKKIGERVA